MPGPDKQPKGRWPLGDYGLSIVLGFLFLASWIGQFFAELIKVGNEARAHGEAFSMSEFWPTFWQSTLENWQSEFLQLLTFVVLTAYLIHRGSAESKDSDEDMQAALERIEARLDQLTGSTNGGGSPVSTYQGAGPPTEARPL
ncbi:MAG: hypothetical protein M3357_15880 [Actinomycetota bacterium]|nr:hypothetical protein [Actinomycetota bacterium]